MAIYNRLIYGNIENFCATRFSRTKTILGDDAWHSLIREFVDRHQSSSPYFSQISEEFISFLLMERQNATDPPFLLELCHFEWLPLYIDRLADELSPFEICNEPLSATLVTSPLAVVRQYQWPVDRLSQSNLLDSPPPKPTSVIAYRDRAEICHVRVTQSAIAQLAERFRTPTPVSEVLEDLLKNSSVSASNLRESLNQRLLDLIDLDVLVVAPLQ